MTEPGEEADATGRRIVEGTTEPGEEADATGRRIVEERRPIVVGEKLDIKAYAARYIYRTKIIRLLFIADRCPSMELDALKIAYDEIKKTADSNMFTEIVAKIDGRLGEEYGPDDDWVDGVDRHTEEREKELKSRLDGYKKTRNKNPIRAGYNELGHFYYVRGNLNEAFENYVRMSDYCTTASDRVYMCLDVILVSTEMGMFSHVASYASKALSQDDLDPQTISKLRCAVGLAYLEDRKYKLAAREFLAISPGTENYFSEMIAPQDIATYGGLCALASFDRKELKSEVIDNINFREFLERVPDVRELINNFFASHVDFSRNYLAVLKPTLLLDIHLHDHVEDLYALIRKKALIQYTLPFSSINLHIMATAFRTSVTGLEQELAVLIANHQIQAHIDPKDKVLHVRHGDQRNSTFRRVLQTGKELLKGMRRMSLM